MNKSLRQDDLQTATIFQFYLDKVTKPQEMLFIAAT